MTDVDPIEALGDPTRRRLFECLRQGPCSVNELVQAVPVSQPAVSQHLRALKEARLVTVRKLGNQRIYSIDPAGLAELRAYVEGLWEDALGAFQEKANQEAVMREVSDSSTILSPVIKTTEVPLPAGRAFRLFTEGIGRWWPLATHSVGEEQTATCVLEGRAGGRIYEVQRDRRQVEWGRVLAWEPPNRLVFSWHPGRQEETAQEVEVTFQESGRITRVVLVHTGWERLGEAGLAIWENYQTGWDIVLGKYLQISSQEATGHSV